MTDAALAARSTYLPKIVAPSNLLDAFERVRDNDEEDGVATRALLRYLEHPTRELDDLAEALRSGSFEPSTLHRVEIPKGDGGVRLLSIPTFTDRVVERAVYQVLVRVLDAELFPSSFGYRQGIGVDDAVDAVARSRDRDGNAWVVRFDFEDCFDSLDHERLIGELVERIEDPWLIDLVSRFVHRSIRIGMRTIRPEAGAAQGSVLSPLLTNLYLHDFDAAMFARGFQVVRYADDVAVPVPDRESADAALDAARKEAAAVSLRLNEKKTWLGQFENGVDFLGVRFTDRVPPWTPETTATDPERRTLFIHRQGAYVALRKGQVKVLDGEDLLLTVPVSLVRQIVMFGRVRMSSWLRNQALEMGIDLVFLSRHGRYVGSASGELNGASDVLPAQIAAMTDLGWSLRLSRQFVAGKIANMRTLLVRRAVRSTTATRLGEDAKALAAARRSALRASTLDELRGVEGAATRRYFAALRLLLPADVGFERRNRRPPRDPVNSLLSFGYALLLPEVEAACRTAGLDPRFGFLHRPGRNRPSMALDLMEEFRPLIVDTVVVAAFNRGTVDAGRDFVIKGDRGCRIRGDKARKRFLSSFENRMLREFAHVPSGVRVSYRRGLHLQARQMAMVLLGLRTSYQPVLWR